VDGIDIPASERNLHKSRPEIVLFKAAPRESRDEEDEKASSAESLKN
jgi:hypothetical protein